MNKVSKKFIALVVTLSATALLSACGEDIAQLTNIDLNTVASFEDLGDCNSKNKGRLVYVDSSEAVYLCADSAWKQVNLSEVKGADGKDGANGKDGKNGSDGKDGKDGTNGTSCTVKALDDGSGYDVLCGDKKVGTLTNGKNGANGADGKNGTNGANGKSAYEIAKENGFKGTEAEWLKSLEGKDGDKGADGKSCTVTPNEEKDGYDLVCGDKTVTITNGHDGESVDGQNGESCIGTTLENGNIQISCGGKVVGELKNGSAGATGKSAYEIAKDNDPSIGSEEEWLASLKGNTGKGCKILDSDEDGVVVVRCGEGDNAKTTKLYKAMCVDKPYDPETLFCHDSKLYDKCGTESYNPNDKFCFKEKLYSKCGLDSYDPEKQFCYDSELYDKCEGEVYNPVKEFCAVKNGFAERVYKKTTITVKSKNYSRTWMAENMNHKTDDESACYDDDEENCKIYGPLYTWEAAMDVCPDGWHLPSDAEWKALFDAVNTSKVEGDNDVGKHLKAKTLWETPCVDKNGISICYNNTDTYGFSALPGGNWGYGKYYEIGREAMFWSSTQSKSKTVFAVLFLHNSDKYNPTSAVQYVSPLTWHLSVRCMQDYDP